MEKKSKEKEGEAEKTRQEEEEERKENREKEDGERATVKGLPHEQVRQPGKDFSSEALENIPKSQVKWSVFDLDTNIVSLSLLSSCLFGNQNMQAKR